MDAGERRCQSDGVINRRRAVPQMGNGGSVGVVLRCVGSGFVGRGRLGLLYAPLKKGLDFYRNVLTGGGYPCGTILSTFGLCSAPER